MNQNDDEESSSINTNVIELQVPIDGRPKRTSLHQKRPSAFQATNRLSGSQRSASETGRYHT